MSEESEAFVPAVGFVVAGLGLASGLLPWTEPMTMGAIQSVPGVVFGAIALLGFAARRYGATDRRFSLLAGAGAIGLAIAAGATALHPSATASGGVGPGMPLGFVLGLLGAGVAIADYRHLGRSALLRRTQYGAAGLFIGFLGLIVGYLFATATYFLLPGGGTVAINGIGTAAFSVGLAVVALAYLRRTGRGLSFLDVRWPTRRGWLYVVGGTLGMFAILIVTGAVTNGLGIESAEHGLVEQAREAPLVLLAFIPLSWLVIGPGEELLSRNIVQKHLYDGFSRPAAVVVGTAIFAAIHLPAYATGPPPAVFATLLQLFGISLVLGVVYERTDNVVVPALVHGTYNAVQFGFAYLAITSGLI